MTVLAVAASADTGLADVAVGPALLLITTVGAALSCLLAARRRPGAASAGWLLVAAASLVAALAHATWLVGAVVRDDPLIDLDPTLGWWAAAPAVVLGFGAVVGGPDNRPALARQLLEGVIVAGTLFTVSWAYGLRDVGPGDTADAGGATAAALFPAVDVVVLVVLAELWRRAGWAGRPAVGVVAAAVALRLAGDLGFAWILVDEGAFGPGRWPEFVWVVSFVVLAAAPWAGPRGDLPAGTQDGPAARRGSLVPYLVVGAGAAAIGVGTLTSDPPVVDSAGLAAACGVILALLARQALTLRDNQRLTRELEVREDQYRSVVQSSQDVITIASPRGEVLFVNSAVGPVFGYEVGELLRRPLGSLVHPDDRRDLAARLRLLRPPPGEDVVTAGLHRVQCRIRGADGRWHHTESTVSLHPHGYVLNSRDVSERVALEGKLARFAYHDALTGLPNRTLFTERIDAAVARAAMGQAAAPTVLFLDLDGFKSVNDSIGHAAGDELLVIAGERLERVADPRDTVSRFGGDEFAVLLDRGLDQETAQVVAERMVAALGEPYALAAGQALVTASVGIAFAEPGTPAEQLLRDADMAMYGAKAQGKGRVAVYAAEMHAEVLHHVELEARLRQALRERRFTLLYQPVVDLETGEVVGVEALIRWRSREGQLMTPAELISFAEDHGQIVEIGAWVIAEATREAARWRASGHPIGVAVNLSAPQIVAPGLVEAVQERLLGSGLPAESLTLEITESVLLDDLEAAAERLQVLRGLGVRLAIDDFGTGYSSLAYLRRLPVDVLKIDRAFVSELGSDPDVAALARTIVGLGRDLGLTLVAEGVERVEQAMVLRELGCHRAQGFYFSGPLDPAGVGAVLRRGPFRVGAALDRRAVARPLT